MVSIGVKMDEEHKCQILLYSLLDSWDSLVMVIGSTFVVLKSEDVVGALLGEDMQMKVLFSSKKVLTIHRRFKENRTKNEKCDII